MITIKHLVLPTFLSYLLYYSDICLNFKQVLDNIVSSKLEVRRFYRVLFIRSSIQMSLLFRNARSADGTYGPHAGRTHDGWAATADGRSAENVCTQVILVYK